jgi:hypothetical protein
LLREPTARAISELFHHKVTREQWEPTDRKLVPQGDNMRHYCKKINVYLNLRAHAKDIVWKQHPSQSSLMMVLGNIILADYDFLAITEHMEESIVVLQLLLGWMKASDVLYLNAKGQGGVDVWGRLLQESMVFHCTAI